MKFNGWGFSLGLLEGCLWNRIGRLRRNAKYVSGRKRKQTVPESNDLEYENKNKSINRGKSMSQKELQLQVQRLAETGDKSALYAAARPDRQKGGDRTVLGHILSSLGIIYISISL